MSQRKLIGWIAFGSLMLVALVSRLVPAFDQDNWGAGWNIAFVIALCAAMAAALYDRKNFPEKTWDFNPGRGALYFLVGLVLFPIMLTFDAISGIDISLSRMVIGTLALSAIAGIAGMFTENVPL